MDKPLQRQRARDLPKNSTNTGRHLWY
ncbi:TPA: ATP-dependent helicase HrpA, partial [Legionella pneumophila]|nr:ATP-dependent helicase HrpA [Legionella pneumophila]